MEMRIYFGQIRKIDWNFHGKERHGHGAGADSVTEHPFVKSECSVKLKKSFRNNPEARTGNAFQVCLQLSLNMFLSPSFLSKGFLLFGDILQGSSIGDCLSVKEQGEEETYWRLVTFYYNPHCTILSGEMDLWNFKLKTRDLGQDCT